ncbi:cysteine synthase A [Caryophanon latum]|uniref:Cysteine synthase n=1 Tax=Caryophanon latum TaxID=33977 RepID=A0A1C0YTF5_9BACL|nr:cysteine synthase A [Caryophanon latum]OCS90431.1 cysteine synthase A [Caryophanon latum]
MMIYQSITDLIGNTPIVRINRLADENGANVYVKLESFNPGGSVKDRAAFNMIARAEQEGKLIPGKSVVIEPTSGNTGIGLAMVCATKGYQCIITMPDNATKERIMLMEAYGATVYLTPAEERMTGSINKAKELLEQFEHGFIPMQFENSANPDAHRNTTAVEIYDAFDGKLDALVLTAGTGGTVTGVGEELKKRIPNLKVYVVEPKGSPVLSGGEPGPHKIVGTGPGFIPTILNQNVYDEILLVEDDPAQQMARDLASKEGILLGTSGAASVYWGIEVAKKLPKDAKVLSLAPDTGERYLSSDLYQL